MKLRDRVVLAVLRRWAHGGLSSAVMALRVRGRRSGEWHEFPVQYAVDGHGLVVFPGHPERKRWWRNLRGGAAVRVMTNGAWQDGSGRVMWADDGAYERSLFAYSRRFPHAAIPFDAPLVRVDLEEST
jgi:hypothetical protein